MVDFPALFGPMSMLKLLKWMYEFAKSLKSVTIDADKLVKFPQ